MGLWSKVKGVFGRIGKTAWKGLKAVGSLAKNVVAKAGAPLGAAIGSVIPGVGTAIGGAIGTGLQTVANVI